MFSDRLKQIRSMRGFTQESAAKILDVSLGTVRNWEQGATEPNTRTIMKLAELFRTTTDFLFGKTDNPEIPGPTTEDRKWLFDKINKSSDEKAARMRRVLEAIDAELDGNQNEDNQG